MDVNVDALVRRKNELEKSLAIATKTRNEMEGKMQSRYDTQREEWALQCDILEAQIQELNKVLSKISQFEVKPTRAVSVGSVVQLRFDEDVLETYILLDESGGHSLENITTLSIQSPVGQAIVGAKVGDSVSVKVGDSQFSVQVVRIGEE